MPMRRVGEAPSTLAGRLSVVLVGLGLSAVAGVVAGAEPDCPSGTLLEPYTNVCARINDVREEFIPTLTTAAVRAAAAEEFPDPGTISIGVRYLPGYFPAASSARLHTRMFVYPDGLGAILPEWLYTPATNRVEQSVEVVGMYRSWNDGKGLFGLFGRPCSVSYPCPNGATGNSWQYARRYEELPCNVSHEIDAHNHVNRVVHYANHSDRLDDLDPPLWKSAVYLWNYCEAEWDLTWEHTFRMQRVDCSVENCSYWGPAIELFGSALYPDVPELGYAESLFIHDGTRSELRPADGAFYMQPESIPNLVQWQTLHLDPNRGFGVGTTADANDPPQITGQAELELLEDTSLLLGPEIVDISDPDVDQRFHASFTLAIEDGADYSHSGNLLIPSQDFAGALTVPVRVSDGAAWSPVFPLAVQVAPVNDLPVITGQPTVTAVERVPYAVSLADVYVYDPDDGPDTLVLQVGDGEGYLREGNSVTPLLGATALSVPITVADAEGFDAFQLQMQVVVIDTDGDRLDDGAELAVYGTDPYRADTDGDTMPDGLEVAEGLDPLDPTDCPAWYCENRPSLVLRILDILRRR